MLIDKMINEEMYGRKGLNTVIDQTACAPAQKEIIALTKEPTHSGLSIGVPSAFPLPNLQQLPPPLKEENGSKVVYVNQVPRSTSSMKMRPMSCVEEELLQELFGCSQSLPLLCSAVNRSNHASPVKSINNNNIVAVGDNV